METPPPGPRSGSPMDLTANDVFKAGWSTRLSWCIVAGVGLHASLLVLSPAWDRPVDPGEDGDPGGQLEVVAVADAPNPAGADPLLLPTIEEVEVALSPEGEGEEDEGEGSGGGGPGTVETLLEGLRGSRAPEPTVVEPQPEEEVADRTETEDDEDGTQAQDGRTHVDGAALLSEYEDALSDGDGPDLDRLSAFRPELALRSPSSWILLRNPSEVGEFLQERFRGPDIDGNPGMLSVAIWIDEGGSVEWAEIHRSSGRTRLDDSALELFQAVARFRPAREDGVRVPMAVVFWLSYPW